MPETTIEQRPIEKALSAVGKGNVHSWTAALFQLFNVHGCSSSELKPAVVIIIVFFSTKRLVRDLKVT